MWASGVADDFRNAETAFTAEIHALELNLSKLGSEVAAKGSIFMQQKESDDRVESDLRERIEEEKRRYDDVCRRKEAEKRRYTVMLGEISQMHAATIASMTSRQKELRLKLEREREIVLEEQKRLGADRSQMKAETRSAQEHRENEAEELQQSVEAQETHVEQLKKEIAQANSAHRKALAEKEKVYADALVKEQVYIDSEKDDIIAALKIEYSREEAIKMNEVRELGEQIREKEKELTRLGVSFDRMEEAGGALGTGQAQFVEAHHMKKQGRGKGKKGGGSKGCAQS
ncbi:unnamed protein product [Symbiodinium microadriaticum]|nr:unnamed protein product [Symbiodinium microadriaticum]